MDAMRPMRRPAPMTSGRRVLAIGLAGLAIVTTCSSVGASPLPAVQADAALAFTGFVVDQAGVLSSNERRRLTTKLGRLQQATGHQFAVVTVTSLHGKEIGRFTDALANRWGVGRMGIDDGIVLLVAPRERTVRISVGRGLERTLTDQLCAKILEKQILPAFRKGAIAAGVEAGVDAIIAQFGSER
jgi:uncharacterized protein